MPRPLQPPETFWHRVDRCAHPPPCPQCCWPWRGTTTLRGYGVVLRTLFGHRETPAHRIAWILHHGRRPKRGSHIALTCALPACCNPLHGQEQTPRATQAASLRSARASRRRRALKVSPALADRLRQAWREQQPITQRQLAAQFGISQTTVSQILAERSCPAASDGIPVTISTPGKDAGRPPQQGASLPTVLCRMPQHRRTEEDDVLTREDRKAGNRQASRGRRHSTHTHEAPGAAGGREDG